MQLTACLYMSQCIKASLHIRLKEDFVPLQAIEDALNAGHERFSFEDRDNVKKTLQDVRLDPELAKETLSTTARKAFMGFITRSRNKANKLEAAKELKALVYFSNIVVTPLLEDINVSIKAPYHLV